MAQIIQYIVTFAKWAIESGPNFIAAVVAVLSALIALFMLIPGDQPEKALQGIVDFLKKFSFKGLPKEPEQK